MDQKLFRVKVILYVMAENESEARLAATQARFDIFECTAQKATRLEPGWEEAVPYNSQDARTCAEILSSPPPVTQPVSMASSDIDRWHPGLQAYSNSSPMPASPG